MRTGCRVDGAPPPSALNILPERAPLESQTSQGESKGLKVDLLVLFSTQSPWGTGRQVSIVALQSLGSVLTLLGLHTCASTPFSLFLCMRVYVCVQEHVWKSDDGLEHRPQEHCQDFLLPWSSPTRLDWLSKTLRDPPVSASVLGLWVCTNIPSNFTWVLGPTLRSSCLESKCLIG